jgi:hypothetical protein
MSRAPRLLTVCAALSLLSCSYVKPADPGPPYRAEVLSATEAGQPGDRLSYQVGEKQFSQLTDLKNMDGRFFNLVFGGELKIDDIVGSQVTRPTFSGGTKPLLRYNIKNGVIVPRDYSTLAMFSAYYQFEQVLGNVESMTGVTQDSVFEKLGKLKILFEPSIKIVGDAVESSIILKLNAAYGDKQFILFRRAALESVPIGLNLQVIAHEFGHALFGISFFKNSTDDCGRFEREYVIKGMNEGFADVVSWAATGSADVLRNSLNIDEIADLRNFSKVNFDFSSLLESDGEKKCNGGIYCIGTLFASSVLKAHEGLGKTNSQADRHATMRTVYSAIAAARDSIDRLSAELLPPQDPQDAGCKSSEKVELNSSYQSKMTAAFLRSFAENLNGEFKSQICKSFDSNFGEVGFSVAARSGVCP